MDVYAHFGLRAGPFEGSADPERYCPTEVHAEARATLEFAITSGKACTLVVGGAGLGKTLVGRVIERELGQRFTILWSDGLSGAAELRATRRGTADATTAGLVQWREQAAGPTALIVDDADALGAAGWRSVLEFAALGTPAGAARLVLLGGPRLRALLDQPAFERLQNRVFRTAVLTPLTADESAVYLAARVRGCGGRLEALFEPEAVRQVVRLGGGIPARLNRLADNALLEAFARGREQVAVRDVQTAVIAIEGRIATTSAASDAVLRESAAADPASPRAATPNMTPRATVPDPNPPTRTAAPAPNAASRAAPPARGSAATAASGTAGIAGGSAARNVAAPNAAAPAAEPGLTKRLAGMEQRLSGVLAALRAARASAGRETPAATPAATPPVVSGGPRVSARTPKVTPIVWKRADAGSATGAKSGGPEGRAQA